MGLWLVRSSHKCTVMLGRVEAVREEGIKHVAMCALVCLKGDNEHSSYKTTEAGLSCKQLYFPMGSLHLLIFSAREIILHKSNMFHFLYKINIYTIFRI